MNWTITQTKDIDLCHALRRSVFIEEQNVNEADEVDGLDCDALHFLAKVKDQPVGTARLLFLGNIGQKSHVIENAVFNIFKLSAKLDFKSLIFQNPIINQQ